MVPRFSPVLGFLQCFVTPRMLCEMMLTDELLLALGGGE